MSTGLRARKKQQTRKAIHRAAMKLFAERGFEAAYADFDRAMRERAPGTSALDALRDWILEAARDHMPDAKDARLEARLRRESPAVAACDVQHMQRFERRLAEAVADDFGEPADAPRTP